MNIILQPRNLEVEADLQELIETQLAELDRHGYRIEKVTVVLDRIDKKKNDTFSNTVSLIADIPGENVVVDRHAADMRTAIVDAVERLDRVLRKTKEKRLKLERRPRSDE